LKRIVLLLEQLRKIPIKLIIIWLLLLTVRRILWITHLFTCRKLIWANKTFMMLQLTKNMRRKIITKQLVLRKDLCIVLLIQFLRGRRANEIVWERRQAALLLIQTLLNWNRLGDKMNKFLVIRVKNAWIIRIKMIS